MTSIEIRQKVQEVSREILKDIIDFCDKHEIEYFMMFGSLIGAVRESGMIPWDDDIDIAMTRKNYLRFFECVNTDGGDLLSKYDVSTNGSGSVKYVSELKVGKLGSKYCPKIGEDLNINKFITVDIFCVDYLKPSYVQNIKRKNKLIKFLSISKLNWSEKRFLIRVFKLGKSPVKYLRIMMLYFIHLIRLLLTEKGIERIMYNIAVDKTSTSDYMGVVVVERPLFFSKDFTLKKADFDDMKVCIPSNYDEMLTKSYGDYMTRPPVDQQHGLDQYEVVLEVN